MKVLFLFFAFHIQLLVHAQVVEYTLPEVFIKFAVHDDSVVFGVVPWSETIISYHLSSSSTTSYSYRGRGPGELEKISRHIAIHNNLLVLASSTFNLNTYQLPFSTLKNYTFQFGIDDVIIHHKQLYIAGSEPTQRYIISFDYEQERVDTLWKSPQEPRLVHLHNKGIIKNGSTLFVYGRYINVFEAWDMATSRMLYKASVPGIAAQANFFDPELDERIKKKMSEARIATGFDIRPPVAPSEYLIKKALFWNNTVLLFAGNYGEHIYLINEKGDVVKQYKSINRILDASISTSGTIYFLVNSGDKLISSQSLEQLLEYTVGK